MARPKKDIKRTETVSVRYTKVEKILVEKYAERSGRRVAEFIHDKTLDHDIKTRLSPEELMVYRNLTGLSNNLNQLTKMAHQRELNAAEIMRTLREVKILIEKLR